MEQVHKLIIFLASPSDVIEERAKARAIVDEINRTTGREKGVVLEVVGWDTDSFPALGDDAQALINAQLPSPSRCDLFLGIMWNRFGSPTPRAGSGTEEEFLRAVESFKANRRPDIMFFFNTAPASLETEAALEQKRKIVKFRDSVQQLGLYANYEGPEAFVAKFRQSVHLWLAQRNVKPAQPPAAPIERAAEPVHGSGTTAETRREELQWFLLDSRFYQARTVQERSDGRIDAQLIPADSEDDAALRALRPDNSHRNQVVNYAYEDDGFLARIAKAERESSQGARIWKFVIEPAKDSNFDLFDDISYNGISSDEIATMRARLILLGEAPARDHEITGLMLGTFVRGGNRSGVEVPQNGIFSDLRSVFEGDDATFMAIARLWAIFYLRASKTCEHVLQLSIGPIRGESMNVVFRGRRRQRYSNQKPAEIRVDGNCHLRR